MELKGEADAKEKREENYQGLGHLVPLGHQADRFESFSQILFLQILLFQKVYLVPAAFAKQGQTGVSGQTAAWRRTQTGRTSEITKEERLCNSEAQNQQIKPPESNRVVLNGSWYTLYSPVQTLPGGGGLWTQV